MVLLGPSSMKMPHRHPTFQVTTSTDLTLQDLTFRGMLLLKYRCFGMLLTVFQNHALRIADVKCFESLGLCPLRLLFISSWAFKADMLTCYLPKELRVCKQWFSDSESSSVKRSHSRCLSTLKVAPICRLSTLIVATF